MIQDNPFDNLRFWSECARQAHYWTGKAIELGIQGEGTRAADAAKMAVANARAARLSNDWD